MQLSLFDHVSAVYSEAVGPITNEQLYRDVARSAGLSDEELNHSAPVGRDNESCKVVKREIRWHQQTLKTAGLIRRSRNRGQWELTQSGKVKLRKIKPKASVLAFSTELGAAIWSLSDDVFTALDAPITLCLTSPPYPLRKPRAYGNPKLEDYIEFVVESLRPIAKNLVQGGSICLNVSNDIFAPGTPARSIYRERLVIALAEELGLWKMDELIWSNPCKPPGPVQWASKTRQQLNTAFEPIYWFCNNPLLAKADNRRVLQPHTDRHLKYVRAGGARKKSVNSDGAYTTRAGAYSRETHGRIPRNILNFPHNCPSQKAYKQLAREHGLPPHSAPYPLALATFLTRFLSAPGDLVVDPFGGSLTTALSAEENKRSWLITECMYEYIRGGGLRFGYLANWEEDFLQVA